MSGQAKGTGTGTTTKIGAQNVVGSSYKTLSKKHKNTKSTSLLHHI